MSAAVAVQKVPKVLPPPSPFGELLRRSRFASFDPDIRQAYTAPPSFIHRGNWGLKRPIANRHPKGHIVLRKFEEHAQFIEWDRADSQVKLIRRMEELNTAPRLVPNSSWSTGLGQASTATESGLDSDFCPGESSEVRLDEEVATDAKPNIDDLGNRGHGEYGSKAKPPPPKPARSDESRMQPNIFAMPPAIFRSYVEKLRKLRPEFIKYVRKELEADYKLDIAGKRRKMTNANPEECSDEELLFAFGLEAQKKDLHMAFLGKYSEEQLGNPDSTVAKPADLANKPQPIQRQPHKFAGLLYAIPSELESYYTAKPQPGLILQDAMPSSGSYRPIEGNEGEFIASFAGISSHLTKRDSGRDVKPLYEPFTDEGIVAKRVVDPITGKVAFNTEDSERKMRALYLYVEDTPQVVGPLSSNVPLFTTKLRAHVVVDNGVDQNFRDNPFTPGSKEYNNLQPLSARSATPRRSVLPQTTDYFSGKERMRSQIRPGKARLPTGPQRGLNETPSNVFVVSALQRMLLASNGVKGSGDSAPTESEKDS